MNGMIAMLRIQGLYDKAIGKVISNPREDVYGRQTCNHDDVSLDRIIIY